MQLPALQLEKGESRRRAGGQAACGDTIRWRTLIGRAEMTRITAEWSVLADQCPASLFVTPEWADAWLETIGKDVEPWIVTARRQDGDGQDGRLLALWPLGVRQVRHLATLRLLEPLGETLASGDRLDPLTAVAGLERDLVGHVRGVAAGQCDLIHWAELDASGPLAEVLASENANHTSRMIQNRVLPLADLPASYEEFASRLGKKLRGHVRRQEQIALRQHGLDWRLNNEGTSLAAAVEAFMELHQQCWRHRGQNGNLAESRFRTFIERFTALAGNRGWLRLHRLCSGERTVAALVAFHHNGRVYYYQSGWDPAIARLSPGSLCVARAIRVAIDEGITVFDFLRGDEPYKRRWANRQEETVTRAEALTLKGRAVLAGRDAKELVKRGMVAVGGSAAWDGLKARLSGSAGRPLFQECVSLPTQKEGAVASYRSPVPERGDD